MYKLLNFADFDKLLLEYLILNRDISNFMGYVMIFKPNFSFHKQAITMCAWEHCIEYMPLDREELSCPIFGHNCPGGLAQVSICKENEEMYIKWTSSV